MDEARCVGCTRCSDACPVDASVGARDLMHTVVENWCIGCGLCLPPCPVDCIDMVPARRPWTLKLKQAAGRRARVRRTRLATEYSRAIDPKAALAAALAKRR